MTNGNMVNSEFRYMGASLDALYKKISLKNDAPDHLNTITELRHRVEELKLSGWEMLVIALLEYEVMIRKRLQKASALRAP